MDSTNNHKDFDHAPGLNESPDRVTQTFTIKIGTGKQDKGTDPGTRRGATVVRGGPSGSEGRSLQTEHSIVESEHRDFKHAKITSRHGG